MICQQKRRRHDLTVDDVVDADVEEVSGVQTPPKFTPLYVISEWTEPGTTKRCLTVAIMLPSGIPSGFTVLVNESRYNLLFTVVWLDHLLN